MSPSATLVCTNGCLPLVLFENKIGRKWACSFINYSLNQVQRGWDEERVYSFKRAPDSARSLALGTAALQQSSLPCSSLELCQGQERQPLAGGWMGDSSTQGLKRTSDFGGWSWPQQNQEHSLRKRTTPSHFSLAAVSWTSLVTFMIKLRQDKQGCQGWTGS